LSASLPAFARPPARRRDASMTTLDRADASETSIGSTHGSEQGCARQVGRAARAARLTGKHSYRVVQTVSMTTAASGLRFGG